MFLLGKIKIDKTVSVLWKFLHYSNKFEAQEIIALYRQWKSPFLILHLSYLFQTLLQTLHLCDCNLNLEIHCFILSYYNTLSTGFIQSILFLFYVVLYQIKFPKNPNFYFSYDPEIIISISILFKVLHSAFRLLWYLLHKHILETFHETWHVAGLPVFCKTILFSCFSKSCLFFKSPLHTFYSSTNSIWSWTCPWNSI